MRVLLTVHSLFCFALSSRLIRSLLLKAKQSLKKTSRTCVMVVRNGDELPASIAFRGDLCLLFQRGHIVRCHCRAWKDVDSGEVIHANRERWLTKTQQPKRITLHPYGSRRAVAVADLAAQGRWLCFRVVCRRRVIRVLCGQRPFHHSCAGIAWPKLGHGTKKLGLRQCGDQSRFGRSVCPVRDRSQPARHRWILRRRVVRAFTRSG